VPRKRLSSKEVREFIDSAEDLLERSRNQRDVVNTLVWSIEGIDVPHVVLIAETIDKLNDRIDKIEAALQDIINLIARKEGVKD